MTKEKETQADLLNSYIHEYFSHAGGAARNVTYIAGGRNGDWGESFYSQARSLEAKGRALYEYLAHGPNENLRENGFSVACEIAAFALLDGIIFKGGRANYNVLFAPSQLDTSVEGSRGFDLLVAKHTKFFNNGQYVNDGILGVDVTRSVRWQSIQFKKRKHPLRSEIELPVIVLPIAQLSKFADFMEAYRQEVVSGKIRFLTLVPQELQHMEGIYHQKIITLVLDEIARIKMGLKKPEEWVEDKLGDFEKFLIGCREK